MPEKRKRKKRVYPWYTRFLERYKCMQWLKEIKTRAQDHFQVFHKVKNTNTFPYDVYNENGKWEMGQTNGIKINQDGKMVTWSYLSVILIWIQLWDENWWKIKKSISLPWERLCLSRYFFNLGRDLEHFKNGMKVKRLTKQKQKDTNKRKY